MTTYKGIKGIPIETIAGDPSNPLVGQVWYNTTSNVLKCYKYAVGTGAWSSATASPQQHTSGGGAGTRDAYIAISGYIGGQPGAGNETYDGTNWTVVNSLTQPRYACTGSFGTQTAAITAGGPDGTDVGGVESWDGTCFTETNDFTRTTGYNAIGGAGTQTAGLLFCGNPGNVVSTAPGVRSFPPPTNPAVEVPELAPLPLAKFRLFTSVHEVPSQISVRAL